jgi:hypothetical protein
MPEGVKKIKNRTKYNVVVVIKGGASPNGGIFREKLLPNTTN